jgi:hypothetical protein
MSPLSPFPCCSRTRCCAAITVTSRRCPVPRRRPPAATLLLWATPSRLHEAKTPHELPHRTLANCLHCPERALIRQEMSQHFGQYPSLADGILLSPWRGGPQKNQPKIRPAIRSMMDRGLVEVRASERGPRAFSRKPGSGGSADWCWTGATWTRRGSRIFSRNSVSNRMGSGCPAAPASPGETSPTLQASRQPLQA